VPNSPGPRHLCSHNPPSGATRALYLEGAVQQVRAKTPTWNGKQKTKQFQQQRAGKPNAPSVELTLSGESQAPACHTRQRCPVGSATAQPPASPGKQTCHAHTARAHAPGWSPRPAAPTQPPAVTHTAPRTGPARPARWDRPPSLLPSPGGLGAARVRPGERQSRNHKQLSCSPKSGCGTLSLRTQLHLSLAVFPLSEATGELHVQKFFPAASHGY